MKYFFMNQIPGKEDTVKLLLYGDVGDGMQCDSGYIVAEIMKLAATYQEIEIHINSKGGDVFSGMAIFNALRECTANISIYVDGIAASIAGVIALCGKPLFMNKYSRLMLHRVSGGTFGNADQLRHSAQLCEDMENDLANMISQKTKKTPEEIKAQYFDGSDHWINAQQAKELGFIDGIIDTDAVIPEASNNTEGVYNFFTNCLKDNKENSMALIEELKKRPSFQNMTDEEAMLQHITTLENEAAKVPALENKVKELNGKLSTVQKNAFDAFLNQAVSEGKITQEQKPVFMNLMASDEANTRAAIEAMPTRTASVENYLHGGAVSTELVNMTWDEIDKAGRLMELKNKYPELYTKKYNEAIH